MRMLLVLAATFLAGCSPTLTFVDAPMTVLPGERVELIAHGMQVPTPADGSVTNVAAIVQVPLGLTIDAVEELFIGNGLIFGTSLAPGPFMPMSTPGITLSPEPGMELVFVSLTPDVPVSFLSFVFRAPTLIGAFSIKVMLLRELNGTVFQPGNWEIVEPLGATSFAQISGIHDVVIDVAARSDLRWRRLSAAGGRVPYAGGVAIGGGPGARRILWDSFLIGETVLAPSGALVNTAATAPSSPYDGPSQLDVGDIDGDGLLDVSTGVAARGDGNGGFAPLAGQLPNMATGSAIEDVNGDGFDDVVWASGTLDRVVCQVWDPALAALVPSSAGLPDQATSFTPAGRYLALEDVDDDGDRDIVWTRNGAAGVWLNDGVANWTEVTNPGFGARDFWAVKAEDFDGDGATDLIFSGYEGSVGSGIAFFRRGVDANGDFVWIEDLTTGLPTDSPYVDLALADFDRDGLVDILAGRGVEGLESGGVEIWRNLGSGRFAQAPSSWTEGLPDSAISDPVGLAVEDFDEDGFVDIALSTRALGLRLYVQSPDSWTLPCEAGTVGLGAGGPFDLLRVNGSPGNLDRMVSLDRSSPITISMDQPPANPNPANYMIFGSFGAPTPGSVFASPWGDFCFAPASFAPQPGRFTLANSFAPSTGLLLFGPTPFSYVRSSGLSFPATFALQGLIVQNGSASNNLALTNAVTIEVR